MQNKGAIRLLAILLALVSVYQLYFTVKARMVEADAREFAAGNEVKEKQYLDSIWGEPVYNFLWLREFTYKDCKERELNLGLDLKGGMNVTLEVSVVDVIKSLSGYSKDSVFIASLDRAKYLQRDAQEDFVTLFGKAWNEIDPNAQMATVFATRELKDKINYQSSNEDVLKVLREETENAIDVSFNVLRSRIDKFGVAQPNIQRLETSGRILVELPGVKEPERVRKLLQGTASLEFFETYKLPEIYQNLLDANEKIKELEGLNNGDIAKTDSVVNGTGSNQGDAIAESANDSTTSPSLLEELEGDSLANDTTNQSLDQWKKDYPLFAVLQPSSSQDQLIDRATVGYTHKKDTSKVNYYLHLPQIKSLFPRDLHFYWTFKPVDESGNVFQLVAIKSKDGRPALTGDVITNAREDFGQTGSRAEVTMSMNSEGAKTWGRLTKDNIQREIAIVLDGYVYSYPTVQNEIKNGVSQITGDFTIEEAQDLANVLKSGKLPAPARILEEEIVGPSLGKEAINSGLWSFFIAFLVVLLYMIFYYNRAGVVANIALLANVFFIIGVLASLGAVLTLPGIAGIVLTIGMSVDANVLIYERIREELKAGKGLKLAVKDGYLNAYSAIIDANITTLLTAVILVYFGKGPIQGFATTLIIGILTSLFSAIFITRLIFTRLMDKDAKITFATKFTENAFQNVAIKFLEKRKTFYIISGIVMLLGVVSLVTRGLNYGVDFKGGRTFVVRFENPVSSVEIADNLKNVYGQAPEVKVYGSDNQMKITTKYLIDYNTLDEPEVDKPALYNDVKEFLNGASYEDFLSMIEKTEYDVDDAVEMKLYQGLEPMLGGLSYNDFISDRSDKMIGRMSSQKVGPTIADDIKKSAVWAILFSLVIIFIYMLFAYFFFSSIFSFRLIVS